jgi:hypothetical protein
MICCLKLFKGILYNRQDYLVVILPIIRDEKNLNVVIIHRSTMSDFFPQKDGSLIPQDELVVLGCSNKIRSLASDYHPFR